MNDSAVADAWLAAQGYLASFPLGTVTAVAASDTFQNGARFTQAGMLRLFDATAGLPAGAVISGGFAFSSTGQLCYTTADPDASSVFINAIACAQNGRVHLSNMSPVMMSSLRVGVTLIGGRVSQWNDRSGNGHHWVQGVAGARPTQSADGSITFNGVDQAMTTTDTVDLTATNKITTYWVAAITQPVSACIMIEHTANSNLGGGYSDYVDNIDRGVHGYLADVGFQNDFKTTSLYVDGQFFVYSGQADRSIAGGVQKSFPQINNAVGTVGVTVGDVTSANFLNAAFFLAARGGSTQWLAWSVKECWIYPVKHTAAQRRRVMNYLNQVHKAY